MAEADQVGTAETSGRWRRLQQVRPYVPILLLITINLIIGVVLLNDYGDSWDEILDYDYGVASLAAYVDRESSAVSNIEKGPFYFMAAKLGGDLLRVFAPDWPALAAWDIFHLLSFQMGVLFLYVFSRRFLTPWMAFSTALLFATQPLLWGHAFINHKDIPFMSFFLASVTVGFLMADAYQQREKRRERNAARAESSGETSFMDTVSKDWQLANPRLKRLFLLVLGISVALLAFFILGRSFIEQVMTNAVIEGYQSQGAGFLGALFARVASNAAGIPVEDYINKGLTLYPRLVLVFFELAVLANFGLMVFVFPTILRPFLSAVWSSLKWGLLIAAAILVGLVTSIRALGPLAGVLVAVYFFSKAGRKALAPLAAYTAIALIVTYITWPGIWRYPIFSFIGHLSTSAEYPWGGKVLFAGIYYEITELPRIFLPVIMSLQFTETAILVFLIGFAVAGVKLYRGTLDRVAMALTMAWFLVPILLVFLNRPVVYDNSRHFLWITPPMFVLAGLGISFLVSKIRNRYFAAGLVIALILPGLYWIVRLHPYQYVYYNSLVGGQVGAFRNYEMDYWATSYKEAIFYLNETAPAESEIVVWGPVHLVEDYLRPDLSVWRYSNPSYVGPTTDYAIITTRFEKDLKDFPAAPAVYQVGRDGAIFAVVKDLQPSE